MGIEWLDQTPPCGSFTVELTDKGREYFSGLQYSGMREALFTTKGWEVTLLEPIVPRLREVHRIKNAKDGQRSSRTSPWSTTSPPLCATVRATPSASRRKARRHSAGRAAAGTSNEPVDGIPRIFRAGDDHTQMDRAGPRAGSGRRAAMCQLAQPRQERTGNPRRTMRSGCSGAGTTDPSTPRPWWATTSTSVRAGRSASCASPKRARGTRSPRS